MESLFEPPQAETPKAKPRGTPFVKGDPRTVAAAKAGKAAALKAQEERDEIARQVALAPLNLAAERAELLSLEITRTCKELAGDLDPRARAQLLTALSRLIDQERVLRGIPNPGSYRPSKPRSESQSSDATPL